MKYRYFLFKHHSPKKYLIVEQVDTFNKLKPTLHKKVVSNINDSIS